MAPIAPIIRNSLKSGLMTVSAVSPNEYPEDGVLESINFQFDTIGQATLRRGSTLVGSAIGGSILGLCNFIDSNGVNNKLITVSGTTVYYLSGTNWIAKRTGLTAASKARFSTFLNYVFMVNGTEATAIWDGDTSTNFLTTGNAASAPTGKFIENFRSRMWIAGNTTYPDRVYYSSIPSAVTTPVITWDTSVTGGQWIDVSPSDGDNITSLHKTKNALLVFKREHLYRIYSIAQADPDPKIDVGTYSHESVVETKNGVYFHHPSGFYRYNGDSVQEVSQPIKDIVQAITLTNYYKVSGSLDTQGDHIEWSVGDVTVNGVSYTNLKVRYTISTQVWTHYSYPTQHLVGCFYNDGSTISAVVGDNAGNVLTLDSGKTDNGTPISYSLIHRFDDIDGFNSTRKTLNTLFFDHQGMTGANVNYQIPIDVTNDWTKKIGQLKSFSTGFSSLSIKGQNFSFRISGTSTGEPIFYRGYEVLVGDAELITFT